MAYRRRISSLEDGGLDEGRFGQAVIAVLGERWNAFCGRVLANRAPMNGLSLSVACCCLALFSGTAVAVSTTDAQDNAEIARYSREIKAISESCQLGTAQWRFRSEMPLAFDNEVVVVDRTEKYSLTGWTGGCREGKRDGFGVLSIGEDSIDNEPGAEGSQSESRWHDLEGTYVEGQAIGLGCIVNSRSEGREMLGKPVLRCSLSGAENTPGFFRKETDGRWTIVDYRSQPIEPLAFVSPGALERESERAIAAAKQGSPIGQFLLPVIVPDFGDILSGGAIVLAPSIENPPLKGKRVAVVLSARAVSELERFSKMRETLINVSARIPKAGRARREEFIAGSNPSRVIASVVAAVKSHAGTAVPAEDLSVLANGAADYVLVFDWRFSGDFALDAKQYAALPACRDASDNSTCYKFFGQAFTGWLVNSRLEAERFYEWDFDGVSAYHTTGDQGEGYKQLFTTLGYISDFEGRFNIDDGDIREKVDEWLKAPDGG